MALFKTLLRYAGLGKSEKMANPPEFVPTNIFKHRYQTPQLLISYVKTLPDNFKDEDIKVKPLEGGRLGLKLPRKLTKEEIEAALEYFETKEEDKRQNGD